MRFVAVDLASTSGWCVGAHDEKPTAGRWILDPGTERSRFDPPAIRFSALYDRLWSMLVGPDNEPIADELWIEASLPPIFAVGATTAATTSLLCGLIAIAQLCAFRAGVKCPAPAKVQDVRAYFIGGRGFIYNGKPIVGRGNLEGKIAKFCVIDRCRQLGVDVVDNNAADATALWHFAVGKRFPGIAAAASPLFEKG